jgi:iron complex outermembrane receptor protein
MGGVNLNISTWKRRSSWILAMAMAGLPAYAQEKSFDIEPQLLSDALKQFALQSGQQIVFLPEAAAPRSSGGVRGSLEPEAALQRILSGTDLSYTRSGEAFVVMQAAAPIVVGAQAGAGAQVQGDGSAGTPQTTAGGDSTSPAVLEEIQVTASRVQRTGYTAPTPTTVVDSDLIETRAATNVATVLYELPAFRPAPTGSQAAANAGAATVNLRGLGSDRTLVLMDGRRLVPADLNQIPALLIQRTEVVTGGASAQWGSDAVAGVLNLITKSDFTGFDAQVQGGMSKYNDYEEINAGFITGTGFSGGRGHVVLAAEYTKNEGTDGWYSRPWGDEEWVLFDNPSAATNGLPRRWITSHNHLATMTPGGIITSGPLRGIQFGPGGEPIQFNYGQLPGATNMIGGDGHGHNFAATLRPAAPVQRESVYANLKFDLTDNVTWFVDGLHSYSHVESTSVPGWTAGPTTQNGTASRQNPLVIRDDNAFLPESIRNAMADLGLTFINMGRISLDMGGYQPHNKNFTTRVATGLEGTWGDWSWDTYYQYGRNRYANDIFNNRIEARWMEAIDAVYVPTVGAPAGLIPGSIVCRSTLTNPGNGCVPMNIFGHGSPSPESHAYVYGVASARTTYTQHTAAFNVRGEPFSTWAGPVSVAAGLEYRNEEQETTSDPISQANGFALGNTKAIKGDFDVTELYVEGVLPLVQNASWAEMLDLQLAARLADYSSVGDVVTWKVGTSWTINDSVRLRASQSRDIRAPNITELYSPPFFQTQTVVDPTWPPPNSYLVSQNTVGNPDLQEEKADTFTFGFVLSPSFLEGFQASVDYWNIKIEDAVGSINANTTIQRCVNGVPGYCNFVIRDPSTNRITSVTLTQINLSSLDTSGIDVEASYTLPLSRISNLPGDLNVRLFGSFLLEKIVDDTITRVDRAGEIGRNTALNGPDFRGSLFVTYALPSFSATVQVSHVTGGNYDNSWGPMDILDNRISSRTYVNLSGRYQVNDQLQIYGVINNLLDQGPAPNPNSGGGSSPFDTGLHDPIGQRYTLGVRFRY